MGWNWTGCGEGRGGGREEREGEKGRSEVHISPDEIQLRREIQPGAALRHGEPPLGLHSLRFLPHPLRGDVQQELPLGGRGGEGRTDLLAPCKLGPARLAVVEWGQAGGAAEGGEPHGGLSFVPSPNADGAVGEACGELKEERGGGRLKGGESIRKVRRASQTQSLCKT